MSTTPPLVGDLVSTEMLSGLNPEGKPFVQLRVIGQAPDGQQIRLLAHVSIDMARQIGAQYMQVAESSVSDAAVASFLQAKLGVEEAVALTIIGELRDHHADADEMSDVDPFPESDGDDG